MIASEYRINKIIHEMSQLYIMFCMPRITVKKTTGEIISTEYVWNNKEAEEAYAKLAELLLFERQAFQQSMHPTSGILRDLQSSATPEQLSAFRLLSIPPTRG